MEENIFAEPVQSSADRGDSIQLKMQRTAASVLDKVEDKTAKWQSEVQEQRRKVLTEHSMLNWLSPFVLNWLLSFCDTFFLYSQIILIKLI